jgi:hypothetical protein
VAAQIGADRLGVDLDGGSARTILELVDPLTKAAGHKHAITAAQ